MDASEKIPSYVKIMEEILFEKRKFIICETISLTKDCDAIIDRKLPHKLKDSTTFHFVENLGQIRKLIYDFWEILL